MSVLDEKAIAEHSAWACCSASARGSHQPPRLIVVTHEPAAASASPVLALVGKGVTFDTGGISIKSADGMERMKDDMAGGAAVLLAMRAISLLDIPAQGDRRRPGRGEHARGRARSGRATCCAGASGRTVEVVNTDAEGRLILGDALWYAQQLGATHLVDIATLTGACMVALGKTTTGMFGRPDDWRDAVCSAANQCGERSWPLPVFDDYSELLKSEIADTSNSGGRYARGDHRGPVHRRIRAKACRGPTSTLPAPRGTTSRSPTFAKGPTGVGVRTLVNLAMTLSSTRDAQPEVSCVPMNLGRRVQAVELP